MSASERFERKYQRGTDDECWLWKAKRWRNGYGSFYFNGRTVGAHRFAWEQVHGPIPDGLEIDHLCNTRACVNPTHMEIVTHAENQRRATGWKKDMMTHCKHGHEFTPDNTYSYIRDGNPRRGCRTCNRERMRRRRAITHTITAG